MGLVQGVEGRETKLDSRSEEWRRGAWCLQGFQVFPTAVDLPPLDHMALTFSPQRLPLKSGGSRQKPNGNTVGGIDSSSIASVAMVAMAVVVMAAGTCPLFVPQANYSTLMGHSW